METQQAELLGETESPREQDGVSAGKTTVSCLYYRLCNTSCISNPLTHLT